MTMPEVSETKQQIRDFVLNLAEQKGITTVADDDNLTQNGVVDSLAIFRVIMFLEDTFAIRIPDEEILTENFESVDGIERFVTAKLAAKSSRR
jgi:acyl carrier protein